MDVAKVAKLANLKITPEEEKKFKSQFEETIKVINQLKELKTERTEITYQVTGLDNITREDEVDETRVLTQDEALSQTKTIEDGYFVVNKILEKDE